MGGLRSAKRGKTSGFVPVFAASTKTRAQEELRKFKGRGLRARLRAHKHRAQAKGRPWVTSFQVLLDRVDLGKLKRRN